MQFVKTAPPKLVTTAQEQLKKADQIKKIRETNKDDAEEWQAVRKIKSTIFPIPHCSLQFPRSIFTLRHLVVENSTIHIEPTPPVDP